MIKFNPKIDKIKVISHEKKKTKLTNTTINDVKLKTGLWKSKNDEVFIDFKNSNLTKFELSDFMSHRNDIVYIYLNNNKLKIISDQLFSTFPNLIWLDLRDNELTYFPTTIRNHPNLHTILLSNNKLTEIPMELGSLPKLKGLSLSDNPLKYPISMKVINEELTESQLINYLQRCWERKNYNVPLKLPEPKVPKVKQIRKELPQIEESSEFILKNSKSSSFENQISASLLKKIIDVQNSIIENRKTTEYLKDWRDRYGNGKMGSKIIPLKDPPYAVYTEYEKMPSRKDIGTEIRNKVLRPKGGLRKARSENLIEDLRNIQETLNELRNGSETLDKSTDEALNKFSARIKKIEALRKIKKKLNTLNIM